MKKGSYNNICDVKGVKVGHHTISNGTQETGVTIIIPGVENPYQQKLVAASYVINGYGKTSGLVQIEELGTLESYIGLTNTLSVGTVQQALVKYMIHLPGNEEIGRKTGSINTVVGECNDGYLNDIRACAIQEEDVYLAIQDAKETFALGSVGAGRGMSCFQMKGGIGSASRIISLDTHEYTIGLLVLSNFGLKKDFLLEHVALDDLAYEELEKGSIMMIIATDVPLSSRQLRRVCKRMSVALARCGSYLGNGSGDIAIAFSTANPIPHYSEQAVLSASYVHEDHMDVVFRGAIDACEEAILSSLLHNETLVGRDDHMRYSLADTIKQQKGQSHF